MSEDRLSRIERSLEALAEQQAQFAFHLIDSGAEFDRRMQESDDRFARQMREGSERHNWEMGEIRQEARALRHELNSAVRASVEEARRERVRRKELDDKLTQLASAQLLTEEKAQAANEKIAQLASAQLLTEDKERALNEKMAELAVTLHVFLKRSGTGSG